MALLLNASLTVAQSAAQENVKQDLRLFPGKLVAQGHNETPVGKNRLLSYRLEEVELQNPVDAQFRGKSHHLTSVLRLTITGESIGGAHTIWIDDAALTGPFGLGANAIGVVIYDRSILSDGAEISVSDGKDIVALPESLILPKEFSAKIDPLVDGGNSIIGMQPGVRISGSFRERIVQIWLTTARPFPVRNAALELQIGKDFFMRGLEVDPEGRTLRVIMPACRFEQLRNGADVVAFFVRPDRSGAFGNEIWYFGKLNKKMLAR